MVNLKASSLVPLTEELEKRILHNPLLNIDTFIIPSPYVKDPLLKKDYDHSFVYVEQGELLGYILVYSDEKKKNFLVYKLITSPFGRGQGIGTLMIEYLTDRIPPRSALHLYVWEKQQDTMDFFTGMGFEAEDTIVYRNLIYHYLTAIRGQIIKQEGRGKKKGSSAREELGKTRHDSRKVVRLLASMVDKLALENCGRIIEDINRETTGLVNILNSFRGSVETDHAVNLRDLLMERIIPYIDVSSHDCEVNLKLESRIPPIKGSYVNISRAMINIISNSLEAIGEKGNRGKIEFYLNQDNSFVYLSIGDNGGGIRKELLEKDEKRRPAFVGKSTKKKKQGEGLGTVQIYSALGSKNIDVSSVYGEGTTWKLRFRKNEEEKEKWFLSLQRRFYEFRDLRETTRLSERTPINALISTIWMMRKMEIFLFDIIMQFSKYHNMRDIFRDTLSYLEGIDNEEKFKETVDSYRSDHKAIKKWMFQTSREIREVRVKLEESINFSDYRGELFASYGQAMENIMIFTLDPETGDFLATDRNLAEHFDFVSYLGKDKDLLLRGEFKGDMKNLEKPILFGVWSIDSDEDLLKKLKLIRQGAKKLMELGIDGEKRLAFYQTTYCNNHRDINTDKSSSFAEFASLKDDELLQFSIESEDELQGFIVHRD